MLQRSFTNNVEMYTHRYFSDR